VWTRRDRATPGTRQPDPPAAGGRRPAARAGETGKTYANDIDKRSHRATQPRANTQLGARRELSN
jgi:hypothetical protein